MTKVAQAVGEWDLSPTLYWVLRDFSLQLVDGKGEPMTHSEYLEQALDSTSTKCATREAIKSVFRKRHLVTLPRPHKGDTMHRLEYQTTNEKFEKFLNTFRSHVCEHSTPFGKGGVPLTGKVYVDFLQNIVEKVNTDGAIPKMEDSWTLISRSQHRDREEQARRELCRVATEECPTDTEEKVRKWIREQCVSYCKTLTFLPPAPDVKEMEARLEEEVFLVCRTAGKVASVEEMAASHVDTFLSSLDRGAVASTPHLFWEFWDGPFPNDAVKKRSAEVLLERVMDGLLKEVLEEARKQEREAMYMEHEDTKIRLEDTEERLRLLSEETASSSLVVAEEEEMCCEIATQTEDPEPSDSEAEKEKKDVAIIVHLQTEVGMLKDKVSELEEGCRLDEEQSLQLTKVYEKNMDVLKRTTSTRLVEMQKERDLALSESRRMKDQKESLAQECDKMRSSLKEAQERTVEMHRSTLVTMRERESEGKKAEEIRRQNFEEICGRLQSSNHENRLLKRRVDELEEKEEESKKMRTVHRKMEMEQVRSSTANELLVEQTTKLKTDNDSLRQKCAELKGKIAVLEATVKLDECRKELS